MPPEKADSSVVLTTDNGYQGGSNVVRLRLPGDPRPARACNQAAPPNACGWGHRCSLAVDHAGPHRSEDFGCAWPVMVERPASKARRLLSREFRRKWILAARASGAARARGSEGALLAAADLRAVARRFHARERELEQPREVIAGRELGRDACVHCGTPQEFSAELCRECGRLPFVEVLLDDDAGV